MGLKDYYGSAEDKYYALIDWLDKRGLSLYPLIDAIEKRNMPSLPLMLGLLVLIVIALFFAFGFLLLPNAAVTFIVSDAETGIALEGAEIVVTLASGAAMDGVTDSEGKLTIAVPLGDSIVGVEKTGYESYESGLAVSAPTEEEISLERVIEFLSKTIQLMEAGTNQLLDEAVTLRFSCSNPEASSFEETETSETGTIDLQVPGNCGSLIAQPVSGHSVTNGVISDIASASAPQLFLEPAAVNTGIVNVSLNDAAGNALSGITVQIFKSDGTLGGVSASSAAGTVSFSNVPTATYYVFANDPLGRFAPYDGSQLAEPDLKQLQQDGTISFNVVMQQASVGKVKVIVKDATDQQPVENAVVYLKKNSAVAATQYTDSAGIGEFDVAENVAYDLEVDAAGYLIATVSNVSASAAFNEVYLERATADNTQTLLVEVVDSRQKPIDSVRLVLKKVDGTIYANDKVTGADGKAEFTALPLDTYFVYAVKKGFEGKTSDPITIKARQQNTLSIVLPIGFGNIEAVVLDDEMQAVQGAIIEVVNVVSDEKEGEGITDLDGKYSLNLRADKRVYFKVDAEGFLPYNSVAVMPDSGSTVSKTIVLAVDPGKLQVKLLGLYIGDEKAPENLELGPGQKYTAKLLLLVARDDSFAEAGIHLRTGEAIEGKTNIMEEDALYLKNVTASTASILKGTSFTPPKGYAIDAGHLTTGDSKWINIAWKNVTSGAYAAEIELQVKESASLGQILPLWYRGWGKTGTYARFPQDMALAGAESTAEKQALYANAEFVRASAGPTNLCDAFFCKIFSIEDTARHLRVNVIDQYPATIGGNYRLFFTISSTAGQAFTNSEILFGSESDGLRFGNYSITDAVGVKSEGVADGYTFSQAVGNLQKESYVFGSIEFKAEKEGSNSLTIVIKSNNQPVLTESINVKVAAAEQLQLDIIPKEIIPLIDNQVLVRVTDSNNQAVSNAIVSVYLEDVLVYSSESDGDGVVEFRLEAPATGSTLVVKAEKTGYRSAEFETVIDSSILSVTPPEISEKLDTALNEVEKQLWFNNQTIAELLITELQFSADFQDLVQFSWDDDYVGRKLGSNQDINAYLLIKLTDKGMLVTKPVKLEGSLSIHLQNTATLDNYVQNVPVVVRIGLGGEVDDEKCLQIEPVEWEIFSSSGEKQGKEFKLTNNCSVEGTPIALREVQARLVTKNENALGEFVLSSTDLAGASELALGKQFAAFADVLPSEFEGNILIEFTADSNVDSAEAEPVIEFRAINFALAGEEKIELQLPVELSISDLKECVTVETVEEPIIVETVPWNFGYGQYGSYSGFDPYHSGGFGGYSTGWGAGYGYGSGYGSPYSTGNWFGSGAYPYSNFSSPYYTKYYDTDEDYNWRYGFGESSFLVKNSCVSAVSIDLDVPPRLNVEDEKFDLEPQSDKVVRIEAGYRMGSYTIDVSAKLKGSKDKSQKIDSVSVLVRRPGEIDDECIQLSTDKIKLNNFIAEPVPAKVFNYCYDVGVRLPQAGNVITFTCQVPGQPMNTFHFSDAGETAGSSEVIRLQPYPDIFAQGNPYYATPNSQALNPYGTTYANEYYVQQGRFGGGYYSDPLGQGSQGYYNSFSASPQGTGNWGFAQAQGYEGACPLIDAVYIVGERKTGGEEGKTIQEVEFEVKPNVQYRKMFCSFMGNLPFETIYGARMAATMSYYRVNVRAAANVKYYNPFGGTTSKYFQVILEDLWGIGDTIDECIRNALTQHCQIRGSPAATGMTCINQNALNFTAKFGTTKGLVPESMFSGNVAQLEPEPQVMRISPAACDAKDSLELLTTSYTDPKSNVSLFFEPIETDCLMFKSAWNIKVIVNRSGMNPVQCAKINTVIRAKVRKTSQLGFGSGEEKEVAIPLSILVPYPGLDEKEINTAKCPVKEELPGGGIPVTPVGKEVKCEAGTTGGAYEKLGFDRLSFDWTWDGIQKQTCDQTSEKEGNKFCDAVQFSIELNRKAEDIKGFVEELDLEKNKNNLKAAFCEKGIGDEDSCVNDYKNSKDLFRWVFRQVKVEDKFHGEGTIKQYERKDLVFFLGADDKILTNEKIEFSSEVKRRADAVKGFKIEEGTLYHVVEKTNDLLMELDKVKEKDSIVAEIEKWGNMTSDEKDLLKGFGLEDSESILTFNEYKQLHDAVYAELKELGKEERKSAASVEVEFPESIEGADGSEKIGGAVTADFLKNLLSNIEFKAGVLHEKEISEEVKKLVIEKAKPIEGLKLNLSENYSSFADFYNKAIDFNSFLVKDGYSADLRSDFDAYYGTQPAYMDEAKPILEATEFEGGEWKFNGSADYYEMEKAGLYDIVIDLDFSEEEEESTNFAFVPKWNVEFELLKDLAALDKQSKNRYADNIFFRLPFDGEVGKESGKSKRDGYGISLSAVPGDITANVASKGEDEAFGFFDSTNGVESFTFYYGQAFAATQEGKILRITGSTFAYNPSTPVKIDLTLQAATQGTEGLLYDLLYNDVSVEETGSILTWYATDGKGLADEKIGEAAGRALCHEIGTEHYGFKRELPGTTKLKGLTFVPFNKPYELRLYCAHGRAAVDSGAGGYQETTLSGFQAEREGAKKITINATEDATEVTLASFIEKIEDSEVCVDASKDSIELLWNSSKFLEGFLTAKAKAEEKK